MTVTFNWQDAMIEVDNTVLQTMGKPKYVQLMLNYDKKLLGIKSCDIDCDNVLIMPEKDVQLVEIPAKTLLKNIWGHMGWETENPRVCVGVYLESYQIVVFDLSEAYELIPGAVV